MLNTQMKSSSLFYMYLMTKRRRVISQRDTKMKDAIIDEDVYFDEGEVYLNESDIIDEIILDDEDLPDVDDEDDEIGSEDDEDGDETCSDDFLDIDANDNAVPNVLSQGIEDSVHIFTRHSSELYAVACSPIDATLVATGGRDNKGFLWKIGQGDCTAELRAHEETVSSLAFSTDGQLLASGGLDATVRVWDTTGNLKCVLMGPADDTEFEWVRWHPRGHLVLAGSSDCNTWMWNADKGYLLNTFSGHGGSVTCGDFTPDGKTICTGSDDATLRIWNPVGGESFHVVKGHPYHSVGLNCLAISSDSTLALTGALDGSVSIVNIRTGKVVDSLSAHSKSVECIGLAPSIPWAATGGKDKKVIIWDLQHSSPRGTCIHEGHVKCLAWLGASRYLATGCRDGRIRIWDSRTVGCARTFSGHSRCIESLSVSCNEDFLVSVSRDGTARVFQISEFKEQ